MPDTSEYFNRIRDHVHGKDPIELQSRAPAILAELVAKTPDSELVRRPGEGKWSISEILAHLADDEIATTWRYRQMIEHSGIHLSGFDQDLWAEMGDYAGRLPHDSLTLFRLLRESNLRFLQKISPYQWDSWGTHAERGRITLRDLAIHMAGHDLNHIAQIRAILSQLT